MYNFLLYEMKMFIFKLNKDMKRVFFLQFLWCKSSKMSQFLKALKYIRKNCKSLNFQFNSYFFQSLSNVTSLIE